MIFLRFLSLFTQNCKIYKIHTIGDFIFLKNMKHWNLFIVIINTKLYLIYITLTHHDLQNFSKINWPDNFDRSLLVLRKKSDLIRFDLNLICQIQIRSDKFNLQFKFRSKKI